MQYFYAILPKLVSFIILILLGVLMVRVKVITETNISLLSGLVVKLILPCLILTQVVTNHISFTTLWGYRRVFLCQGSTYFVLIAAGYLIIRICRLDHPSSNAVFGCIIGGNYGFVVIPLMQALFADKGGGPYIAVCAAIDTLFMWSLGIYLFTVWGLGEKFSPGRMARKILNPVFCTFVAGMLLEQLGLTLPDQIVSVAESLSNASSLGLVYLGGALCFTSLERIRNKLPILLTVLLRQILIPVLVFLAFRNLLTEVETLCIVLITGSPTLSAASMIARQNRLDPDYASATVFVTTIASIVTIPLVFFIIAQI